MTQWYSIVAKDQPENPVDVFIYDAIGDYLGDSTSATGFIRDLQAFNGRRIRLRMNSPGGQVTHGLAIYNYLKSRGNVETCVDGYVASIATIVALAGEKVTIAKNGLWMIHNVSGACSGSEAEMRRVAGVMAKFNDVLVQTYCEEAKCTEKQTRQWMEEETWFNAEEAKAAGFVDKIGDGMAFSAHAEVLRFPKAPQALKLLACNSIEADLKKSAPAAILGANLADSAAEAERFVIAAKGRDYIAAAYKANGVDVADRSVSAQYARLAVLQHEQSFILGERSAIAATESQRKLVWSLATQLFSKDQLRATGDAAADDLNGRRLLYFNYVEPAGMRTDDIIARYGARPKRHAVKFAASAGKASNETELQARAREILKKLI